MKFIAKKLLPLKLWFPPWKISIFFQSIQPGSVHTKKMIIALANVCMTKKNVWIFERIFIANFAVRISFFVIFWWCEVWCEKQRTKKKMYWRSFCYLSQPNQTSYYPPKQNSLARLEFWFFFQSSNCQTFQYWATISKSIMDLKTHLNLSFLWLTKDMKKDETKHDCAIRKLPKSIITPCSLLCENYFCIVVI